MIPLHWQLCRRGGLRKAKILPFDQVNKFPEDSFDTIVLMGNNFGLFGGFEKAKKLHKLHRITSANATIIATTIDPYKTDNPIHLRYHKLNHRRGRMLGQLRIRIRHGDVIGPWFDYLLAPKDEVKKLIAGTGWKIKRFIEPKGPGYAVAIEKQ